MIVTLASSIIRLLEAKLPDILRQFPQWQRWSRRLVKRSGSLMVTVIDLHKQVPVIPLAKEDEG